MLLFFCVVILVISAWMLTNVFTLLWLSLLSSMTIYIVFSFFTGKPKQLPSTNKTVFLGVGLYWFLLHYCSIYMFWTLVWNLTLHGWTSMQNIVYRITIITYYTPSVPKYKTFWQFDLSCQNTLYLGTERVLRISSFWIWYCIITCDVLDPLHLRKAKRIMNILRCYKPAFFFVRTASDMIALLIPSV
jgi:hypothetical protein